MLGLHAARHRAYELLEREAPEDRSARWLHRLLLLLIVLNVTSSVIDTIPAINAAYDPLFDRFEAVSMVIFGVEYLARLWVTPENPLFKQQSSIAARLAWMRSSAGVVDLIAVVPFLLSMAVDVDLRVIVLLRLLRFFKIARYSPGFRSLSDAVRAERNALVACLVILMSVILVSAGMMYAVENVAQPDKFGSIPEAMWWAASTVTTVGYGDVVPVTIAGRIIGVLTMISGLLMFALPAGIIATSFASTIARHNFVVTAAMVARLPLFAGLEASAIIDVLPFIATRTYNADAYILHSGQPAGILHIITEGRAIVERGAGGRILGPGEAFGAVARSHFGVRAINSLKLLVIEAHDVAAISREHPEVAVRLGRIEELLRRPQRPVMAPPTAFSLEL